MIVRPDSSARYGEETVRWRIQGDCLWLAIGGAWAVYGLRVRGNRMTLSGGDLTDPITFDRTGPPTPRPANVAIPRTSKSEASEKEIPFLRFSGSACTFSADFTT